MYNLFRKMGLYLVCVTCWYIILPINSVLAASSALNIDTSLEPQVIQPPSMFSLLIRLVFSLLFISAIAYLTMKLLKKNMKVLSAGVNIKVLDQYAFSMNKGLYITQIAGKVYVLGVTDHNINLLTEITDSDMIDEIIAKAKEKEMEPIIPAGIMERILPGVFNQKGPGGNTFNKHIQKQIKKLQTLVDNRVEASRRDDENEQ